MTRYVPAPPEERTDDDLVQLCLELYSRTFAYPDSEELHNSAFAAIKVLKDRLKALRAAPAVPTQADEIEALKHDIERHMDIANQYLNENISLKEQLASLAVPAAVSGEAVAWMNPISSNSISAANYADGGDLLKKIFHIPLFAHPPRMRELREALQACVDYMEKDTGAEDKVYTYEVFRAIVDSAKAILAESANG